MAVNLSPIGNSEQFFDNNGIPLNGGLIYTYQAGSSTPLATYTDINGTVPNSNPIVLNTAGRLANEVWLTYGFNYKFVLKDSTGSTIATYDNIYGMVGVQTAVGTTIPAGMISLWYGSLGSIPTGWYLCDGSNGTPDLRDRFIIGAGSTYSVGATGGSTTHTITTSEMPSHTHTATVTDPGHVHTYPLGSGYYDPVQNPGIPTNTPSSRQWTSNNTGSAVTGITVSNATTGSGTSFSILNPYYALAYVMKS